jgi:hypothetical protein
MLVCHDCENMQVLEGEKSTVKALYQKIAADKRHEKVEIFYQGNVEKRAFDDGSMAFKWVEAKEVNSLRKNFEPLDFGKNPINMLNLETAVGSRKYAQVIDAPSKCYIRLTTNKVATRM